MKSNVESRLFKPFMKHLAIGLLISCAGFALFATERKRKEQQRTWVIVVAFVLMAIGFIYSLGFSDIFLYGSMFNMLNNS